MEGAAEISPRGLRGPLPDRSGWDVNSRIVMLTAPTCSPCGIVQKYAWASWPFSTGWEGVAKIGNIFWLAMIGGSMNLLRSRSFPGLLPPHPTRR